MSTRLTLQDDMDPQAWADAPEMIYETFCIASGLVWLEINTERLYEHDEPHIIDIGLYWDAERKRPVEGGDCIKLDEATLEARVAIRHAIHDEQCRRSDAKRALRDYQAVQRILEGAR